MGRVGRAREADLAGQRQVDDSERWRQEEAGGRARQRREHRRNRRVERRQVGWAGDMAPGLRVWRGKTLSKRGSPGAQQVPFQALPALPATFHPV